MRAKLTRVGCTLSMGLFLLGAPACASPHGRVYVRVGPPAPIVEMRGVAPGPRYVWIDGFHCWDGRRYEWIGGRWALPPRANARWVPGRWAHARHGWYWIEGHW